MSVSQQEERCQIFRERNPRDIDVSESQASRKMKVRVGGDEIDRLSIELRVAASGVRESWQLLPCARDTLVPQE